MKNTIILLALAIFMVFAGCKPGKITCTITSPKDGAKLSLNDDLIIQVEASDEAPPNPNIDHKK